jgi:hypothetical protein
MSAQARLLDFLKSPSGLLVLVLIMVAGWFVVTAYGEYLMRWLPYGLVLVCPLIHLLLHSRHGSDSNQTDHTHHAEAEE